MPAIEKTPENLRPYLFHKVDLNWKDGDLEARGLCPLCGADKFTVQIEKGFWRCLSCNEGAEKGEVIKGGNPTTFLRYLWNRGDKITTPGDYTKFAAERGLLFPETLMRWEVVKSPVTGEWLVPGYNPEGSLCQLYRYMRAEGRMKCILTPTLGHKIHGMNLFKPRASTVFIAEGPWDGMALWETLAHTRKDGSEYLSTSNEESSLLHDASVIAVPGTLTFFDSWCKLFHNKVVNLMYDSDHPKVNEVTKQIRPSAGLDGMKRVGKVLAESDTPPSRINYLNWGSDGYDPMLKDGHDIRDHLAYTANT